MMDDCTNNKEGDAHFQRYERWQVLERDHNYQYLALCVYQMTGDGRLSIYRIEM